jgi:hypothetical protein
MTRKKTSFAFETGNEVRRRTGQMMLQWNESGALVEVHAPSLLPHLLGQSDITATSIDTNCSFFRLPMEIRLKIYGYTRAIESSRFLVPDSGLVDIAPSIISTAKLGGLCLANRTIMYEALLSYMEHTDFVVRNYLAHRNLLNFIAKFPAGQGFSSIRNLTTNESDLTESYLLRLPGLHKLTIEIISLSLLKPNLGNQPSLTLHTADDYRESNLYRKLLEMKSLREVVLCCGIRRGGERWILEMTGCKTENDLFAVVISYVAQLVEDAKKDVRVRSVFVKNDNRSFDG